MDSVLWLKDCTRDQAAQVGGKAVGLGALLAQGFPVPPGFAITTAAYRRSVAAAGIADLITEVLADPSKDDRQTSEQIVALFDESAIAQDVAAEITAAYHQLGQSFGLPVAVRSSATAEDLANASFAGQQDTYLWVQGDEALRAHVVRCWASLFTPRAIGYRLRFDVGPEDLAMGVVVQEMVPAHAAGVMMTLEPVTGDRTQILIEAAYGLGEGVVRGDVGTDRFWVDKGSLTMRTKTVGAKRHAHRFDEDRGEVCLCDVPVAEQTQPALDADEVLAVARLGKKIEMEFGAPMDIEWAIAGDSGKREILLLQARPETVWSQKSPAVVDSASHPKAPQVDEGWDPLHSVSESHLHWTTSNLGEAMPGVLTPLSWTLWARAIERAPREAAYNIGALTRAERRVAHRVNDRATRIFFGRPAIQVEFFALIGDRMPGTSGRETVASLFGRVPDDMAFAPTRRRYPIIAVRLPLTFLTTPSRMRAFAQDQERWYRTRIGTVGQLGLPAARDLLHDARNHLEAALIMQVNGTLGVIQPLFGALVKLAEEAGFDDVHSLTAMGGGAEINLVSDIWEASRGRLDVTEVQRRHGFHGPSEGELSSTPWRQNPAPLQRLIAEYAARDGADEPRERERRHAAGRPALEQRFLNSLPTAKRVAARALLKFGASRIPLRGVAKRSFLQAFDMARAAAEQIGTLLHAEGIIKAPDDIFYLTFDELCGTLPTDPADIVATRRGRRREYQQLAPASEWTGQPDATTAALTAEDNDGIDTISGVGVSSGSVEGIARVVTSPDDEDIEPDEILIAPFTDPSWSSLMFISAALVVDIGGALSHAAVVARELDLPCVVNTRIGTSVIHTGDRVRVDGTSGKVTILQRTQ
jgi:rifampicin phosphotransferase